MNPDCLCAICVNYREYIHRYGYQMYSDVQDVKPDVQDVQDVQDIETSHVFQYFLRRANNCECRCGVCASCISDDDYMKIVMSHYTFIPFCLCMHCVDYRRHQ